MERMGDILAKNATRRRAASGPLSPAAKPEPAPTPPAAPGRPAPASRMQRATTTTPLARRVTPRPRVAPVVPSAGSASARPAQAINRYRHIPDAQPQPEDQPSADALNSDRILELPRRGATSRRVSTSEPQPASADQTTPQPTSAIGGPATPNAPAAPSRPPTSSGRASSPLPLRELAQGYVAAQVRKPAAAPTRPAARAAEKSKRDPNVCPHCGGSGWVRLDVPVGDPAFGKAIACSCKERQQEEQRRSDLRRLSSLEPFHDKTFDTLDLRAAPGLEEAYRVAREYAEQPWGWLVLRGGYGCGKTHLAAAIANYRLAAGSPVFFSIVPDLLDHLRAAFAPNSDLTYDALFDRIREVELLVLDDLGAENGTAWATEKLFQLINYRYNSRMPMVITTNNRLLSHMDDRIASRLADVGLVQNVVIEASDYRKRHAASAPRARRTGDTGGGPPRGRSGYSR